ncbi:MSRA5, partial [Symbiodinium sp. KB8]
GSKVKGVTYRSMGDHTETVAVEFDPSVLSYEDLLAWFWTSHNPRGAQRSRQYMKALFTLGDDQAAVAAKSVKAVTQAVGAKPTTVVTPLTTFFVAEDYHQKYYLRNRSRVVAAAGLTTDEVLLKSTLAARLCGFVGGHGDQALVDEVAAEHGLPEDVASALKANLPEAASAAPTLETATAAAAAAAGSGGQGGKGCLLM